MVLYGQELEGHSAARGIAGNLLFVANCLGTSLYVITVKVALGRGYPASTVTAWSCMPACGSNPRLADQPALLRTRSRPAPAQTCAARA